MHRTIVNMQVKNTQRRFINNRINFGTPATNMVSPPKIEIVLHTLRAITILADGVVSFCIWFAILNNTISHQHTISKKNT